jgi:chromosomal replication initiation ATPase DnaA
MKPKPLADPNAQLLKEIGVLEVRRERLTKLLELRKSVAALETTIYMGTSLDAVTKIACDTVCAHFQISAEKVRSRSREINIALPRQIIFHIIRQNSDATLASIGRVFKRDHGTILHGIRAVAARKETDPHFADSLRSIELKCAVIVAEHRAQQSTPGIEYAPLQRSAA